MSKARRARSGLTSDIDVYEQVDNMMDDIDRRMEQHSLKTNIFQEVLDSKSIYYKSPRTSGYTLDEQKSILMQSAIEEKDNWVFGKLKDKFGIKSKN